MTTSTRSAGNGRRQRKIPNRRSRQPATADVPLNNKLTARQSAFVGEYLKDLNASQAAVRAGYTGDPNTTGPRLLANVGIRARIDAGVAGRAARLELTTDRILLELQRLALFDIRKLYNFDGSFKQVHELDADTAAGIMSVEVVMATNGSQTVKRIRVVDKKAALELAMRHHGMLNDNATSDLPLVTVKDFTGRKHADVRD